MTDQRRDRLDVLAASLLIVCCALWGVNQVVVKATLPEIPPLLQAGLRSSIAALLLWGLATVRGIPLFERDGSGPGGLAAGLLFGAEFVCVYLGLQYTTASRLVVFLYLAPFVVAVGMPFISRAERLTLPQWVGLAAAFSGLAYAFQEGFSLSGQTGTQGSISWIGDTLALASGLLWGLTTLSVRATRLSQASAEKTLFYQLAVSAPVLLGASLLSGETSAGIGFSASAVASVLFQSVVIAFASYLGWFWLLRHYPATRLSAFTFLTPVFGLIFGALLLDEPITTRLVVALVAIASGIWLVNRR